MTHLVDILESQSGHHARLYAAIVNDMVVFTATGNGPALRDATKRLNEVVRETLGVAELMGAFEALKLAAKVLPQMDFRADSERLLTFADAPTQTIIPRFTFDEAVEDLLRRIPVTIRDAADRTFRRISELYGEGANIAFVRSAEQAVTARAQAVITQAVEFGTPESDFIRGGKVRPGAGKKLVTASAFARETTAAWSESYAAMAFRTNLNTAATAGQFRQAQDPDIKAVLPAFMFNDAGDGDVRPNHHAGNGLIFASDHPVWLTHSSPLGYS